MLPFNCVPHRQTAAPACRQANFLVTLSALNPIPAPLATHLCIVSTGTGMGLSYSPHNTT